MLIAETFLPVAFISGGFVFAGPMRQARYVTMLQPVQQKYGRLVVFLVYLASLSGDVFWTASILSALGNLDFFRFVIFHSHIEQLEEECMMVGLSMKDVLC